MGRWISLLTDCIASQDLTPFGLQASSNNPALEFFLEGVPLSYVGVNPSNADSDRGYRETIASGFAQDFVRVNSRLTVNVGLRYDFYSNPTEAYGRSPLFQTRRRIPRQPSASYLPGHRWIFCHPRQALHGTSSATAKLWCGADSASIATSSRQSCSDSTGFYRLSSIWRNSFSLSF